VARNPFRATVTIKKRDIEFPNTGLTRRHRGTSGLYRQIDNPDGMMMSLLQAIGFVDCGDRATFWTFNVCLRGLGNNQGFCDSRRQSHSDHSEAQQ